MQPRYRAENQSGSLTDEVRSPHEMNGAEHLRGRIAHHVSNPDEKTETDQRCGVLTVNDRRHQQRDCQKYKPAGKHYKEVKPDLEDRPRFSGDVVLYPH